MTSVKDMSKKVNSVRRKLGELTNVYADQSTAQSNQTMHLKSFARVETSSEEICDTIEAFMNASCSKYAANKTIQKICSSNSSKEIDLTLNHLSMSENLDGEDRHHPNVTTSPMLHTTTGLHQTTMHGQPEFAFNVLPPCKSESEQELRRLIDECAEEKEKVEAGIASLEKYLARMKENEDKLEAMKREGLNGKGDSANDEVSSVKAKIKKFEKEILALKKKEAQRAKEEVALRKRLEQLAGEGENEENSIREDEGAEKDKERLEARLKMIEALTSWPVQE